MCPTPTSRLLPRGLTLLELMVTVGLVGILASVMLTYGRGNNRAAQLEAASRGLLAGVAAARSNAMSTGRPTCFSIDKGVFVAFVDKDGDRAFGTGDQLLYRYPSGKTAVLPSDMEAFSVTLQEKGAGPQTAVYDGRGYYIDSFNGASIHDSNVCLRDKQTGRAVNLQLSRLGWAGPTGEGCADQPACPQ